MFSNNILTATITRLFGPSDEYTELWVLTEIQPNAHYFVY